MPRSIVCIAHDIRSAHNVGSLLRTCEGLGVDTLYIGGYSPYPIAKNDERLPHEASKIHNRIAKTALGAENTMHWERYSNVETLIGELKNNNYQIVALEQAPSAVILPDFKTTRNIALVLGREVEGIDNNILAMCDTCVEIPMFGKKESYNVVQAAAMTLYHLTFIA